MGGVVDVARGAGNHVEQLYVSLRILHFDVVDADVLRAKVRTRRRVVYVAEDDTVLGHGDVFERRRDRGGQDDVVQGVFADVRA